MILVAESEGPDQTVRKRRLIWVFAVRICPKTRGPYDVANVMSQKFYNTWLHTSIHVLVTYTVKKCHNTWLHILASNVITASVTPRFLLKNGSTSTAKYKGLIFVIISYEIYEIRLRLVSWISCECKILYLLPKRTTKALITLCRCAVWSGPSLSGDRYMEKAFTKLYAMRRLIRVLISCTFSHITVLKLRPMYTLVDRRDATSENGPSDMGTQRRFRSACAFA